MYYVIMHNDDFTSMEFVVRILKMIFRKGDGEAEQLMMHVHKNGSAQVGIYTYDMATTKSQEAMRLAREEGFPFRLTVEPVLSQGDLPF